MFIKVQITIFVLIVKMYTVFAFHLSPDQIFLMINGQASDKISPYQVPLEYYVTAEMGDCIYTNTLQSTQTMYSSDDFSSVGSTHGVGLAPGKKPPFHESFTTSSSRK